MLAIALQGISGMNFFASGVLEEFNRNKIKPDIISASSGAIVSAYHFLYPEEDIIRFNQYFSSGYGAGFDRVNLVLALMFGKRKVFRPVYPWEKWMKEFPFEKPEKWINFCFPAQSHVPLFPKDIFETIAAGFEASETGILINAYDYINDKAIVYINSAAREKIGEKLSYYNEIVIKSMSVQGVIASMQFLQFGDFQGQYDGSYQYNPLLYPLVIADHIILVTAQPFKKALKERLGSIFDQEDFKLKMLYKNSLYAQLNQIQLINKLVRKKLLPPEYKDVTINIIQPSMDRGYFDYYIESQEFFDEGVEQAQIFCEENHEICNEGKGKYKT